MRLEKSWLFGAGLMLTACSGGVFKGGTTSGDAGASVLSSDASSSSIDSSRSGDSNKAEVPLPSSSVTAVLRARCEKAAAAGLKTTEQTISYPERKTCTWGVSPNLERKDQFVQAAEISPATLMLPAGDICSINIDSPNDAKLHYDDFLILSIDSRIVFLSNSGLTRYLSPPDQGILTWNFSKIVGKPINNFEADAYCLGRGADCVLPGHDMEGPVALHLTPNEIAPIAASISGKGSVAMNLTATGDNDDTDCWHTALDVKVKIQYVP